MSLDEGTDRRLMKQFAPSSCPNQSNSISFHPWYSLTSKIKILANEHKVDAESVRKHKVTGPCAVDYDGITM
jgi:hypothetical protein